MIVANWKMHGTTDSVDAFAAAWHGAPRGVDVVFCPPLGYLSRLAAALAGSNVRFGAQNVAIDPSGAFTGEHAAEMAVDLGAEFAIVGHSERRSMFGESDETVARKFGAARRAGLEPIICVGETFDQRSQGQAERVVLAQLDSVIECCGVASFENAAIAYEPVWAIGTGITATPEQAQSMHATIRQWVVDKAPSLAETVRILYGGSVNASNATGLFAQTDIEGGLVGSASLDAAEFGAICSAVA